MGHGGEGDSVAPEENERKPWLGNDTRNSRSSLRQPKNEGNGGEIEMAGEDEDRWRRHVSDKERETREGNRRG